MSGQFMLVDRDWYEQMSAHRNSGYQPGIQPMVPETWRVQRSRIWLVITPPVIPHAIQGFKIHLSTRLGEAKELLRRVVPLLVSSETSFKLVADPWLLTHMNGKRAPRGSAGKFVTIYPQSTEAFITLIQSLADVTRGLSGPTILSDRRFQGSAVVHYRYGGFATRERLTPGGERELLISRPSGELMADTRQPFYSLPDWITDPFPDNEPEPDEDITLNGRYRVLVALSHSNAGGVYRARDDVSGKEVIVKEARPHAGIVTHAGLTIDAVDRLRHQYSILQRLRGLGVTPEPLDLFSDWEHTFGVEEIVSGLPLNALRGREEMALVAFVHWSAPLTDEYVRRFALIGLQLIAALKKVHDAGVILGDVAPQNVFIDPDTFAAKFIDLEGSYTVDEADDFEGFAARWNTPGYRSGSVGGQQNDVFALGRVLFGLMMPSQAIMELNPEAQELFLRRFEESGLPKRAASAIRALLRCRADTAQRCLEGIVA
jgi:hypothetical protein